VKDREIAVVSGLPRCGTSMMMRMLEAGGIPALVDGVRVADEDNPRGYYEFERVKKLPGDVGWLPDAEGRVVKIVSALLPQLPPAWSYRVVFMERAMDEILASQRTMLVRHGRDADAVPDAERAESFSRHLDSLFGWLARQPNFAVLRVDYNSMVAAPQGPAAAVCAFFGGKLDTGAMAGVVDPDLHRQRVAPGR